MINSMDKNIQVLIGFSLFSVGGVMLCGVEVKSEQMSHEAFVEESE